MRIGAPGRARHDDVDRALCFHRESVALVEPMGRTALQGVQTHRHSLRVRPYA